MCGVKVRKEGRSGTEASPSERATIADIHLTYIWMMDDGLWTAGEPLCAAPGSPHTRRIYEFTIYYLVWPAGAGRRELATSSDDGAAGAGASGRI